MFVWRVREVALRQGIGSATQLAERAGIAYGTATSLWYGRPTRVDLPTLGRVCRALRCTPSDLLEYVPDDQHPPVVVGA